MGQFVNQLEQIAAVRLLEFLSDKKPWNRSLWGISTVLAIKELGEACVALSQDHLRDSSIQPMCTSLLARVGQDPAISEPERQFLRKQLAIVPRAMSLQHYATHEVAARIDANYLERWSAAIGVSRKPLRIELFARSIASHVLDAGFSGQYMHRFIKKKLNEAGQFNLAQLCEALHAEMVSNPQRKFEVLLAYSALPRFPNGIPDGWLQGAQTTAWLRENGFDVAGIRAPASMIIEVSARDPAGAANAARNESDRFAARALIATGEPLHRIPKVWVRELQSPPPLRTICVGLVSRSCFGRTGCSPAMSLMASTPRLNCWPTWKAARHQPLSRVAGQLSKDSLVHATIDLPLRKISRAWLHVRSPVRNSPHSPTKPRNRIRNSVPHWQGRLAIGSARGSWHN